MSGTKCAGCLGLMLLLLVGACGGTETPDEAQYRVVPPGFAADQVNVDDNMMNGPDLLNPSVQIRIDKTDPTVKRPDTSLVRPVKRVPCPDCVEPEFVPPPDRDLIRCGENIVNISSDPEHCGACFNACATSDCVDGACVQGH